MPPHPSSGPVQSVLPIPPPCHATRPPPAPQNIPRPSLPPLPSKGIHPQHENVPEAERGPHIKCGGTIHCRHRAMPRSTSHHPHLLPQLYPAICHRSGMVPGTRTCQGMQSRPPLQQQGLRSLSMTFDVPPVWHLPRSHSRPLHLPRAMNTCPPWHVLMLWNAIEALASTVGAPIFIIDY
ncbi:hypothetical protein BKA93DRAFT_825337 [Sparassis latifolia]